MKVKLSISINEQLLSKIDQLVESGIFRNRSHAVDFAIDLEGGIKNGN